MDRRRTFRSPTPLAIRSRSSPKAIPEASEHLGRAAGAKQAAPRPVRVQRNRYFIEALDR